MNVRNNWNPRHNGMMPRHGMMPRWLNAVVRKAICLGPVAVVDGRFTADISQPNATPLFAVNVYETYFSSITILTDGDIYYHLDRTTGSLIALDRNTNCGLAKEAVAAYLNNKGNQIELIGHRYKVTNDACAHLSYDALLEQMARIK